MKYKSKVWIGFLVSIAVGWPILSPDYRPGQVILATGFAYIAVRLFGYVLASRSGKDIYSQLDEKEDNEDS